MSGIVKPLPGICLYDEAGNEFKRNKRGICEMKIWQLLSNKERLFNSTFYRHIPLYEKHKKLISYEAQFIFFIVPKSASTSLERMFRQQPEIEKIKLVRTPNVILQKKYDGYFKTAFVRNPWDRLVSAYKNKICNDRRELVEPFFVRYPQLSYKMAFDEFVEYVCSADGMDDKTDIHWKSQHCFFSSGEKLLPNFIGKVENLAGDYAEICKINNFTEVKLQRVNASKTRTVADLSKTYKQYYNAKTKKMIANRYEKDIELFSYKFDE